MRCLASDTMASIGPAGVGFFFVSAAASLLVRASARCVVAASGSSRAAAIRSTRRQRWFSSRQDVMLRTRCRCYQVALAGTLAETRSSWIVVLSHIVPASHNHCFVEG